MNHLVTVWHVWDAAMKTRKFNHISAGFDSDALVPTPMCEYQRKAWSMRTWVPTPAMLINGVVVDQ